MTQRRSALTGRMVLALVCGVAALVVSIGVHVGFLVSLLLAVVVAAFVYVLAGARQPRAGARSPGRPSAPQRLPNGQAVVTLRAVAGATSEYVPAGSTGVVVGAGWGKVQVQFLIRSPMGDRQIVVGYAAEDLRPA